MDWVPSIHLGYKVKREPIERVECSDKFEFIEQGQSSLQDFTEELNSDDRSMRDPSTPTNSHLISVSSQTDDKLTGMSDDIIVTLHEKIAFLEEKLKSHTDCIAPT